MQFDKANITFYQGTLFDRFCNSSSCLPAILIFSDFLTKGKKAFAYPFISR
jgi:hypothetical protein